MCYLNGPWNRVHYFSGGPGQATQDVPLWLIDYFELNNGRNGRGGRASLSSVPIILKPGNESPLWKKDTPPCSGAEKAAFSPEVGCLECRWLYKQQLLLLLINCTNPNAVWNSLLNEAPKPEFSLSWQFLTDLCLPKVYKSRPLWSLL